MFFNHTFFQSRMLITYLPADLLNQFYTYLAAAATVVIFSFPSTQDFQIKALLDRNQQNFLFFTLTRLTGSLIFALMASMFILIWGNSFPSLIYFYPLSFLPLLICFDLLPLLLQSKGNLSLLQTLTAVNSLITYLSLRYCIMTGTNNIFNTLVISKACLSLVSFLLYYYLNFREHSHYSVLSLFCILKNKWRSLLSPPFSLHILNTFFNVGLSKLDIFALSFLDNGQYVSSYSIALQVPNAIKSLIKPHTQNLLILYCNVNSKLPRLQSYSLRSIYLYSIFGFLASIFFSYFYLKVFLMDKLPLSFSLACFLSVPLLYLFIGTFYSQGELYLGTSKLVLYCSVFPIDLLLTSLSLFFLFRCIWCCKCSVNKIYCSAHHYSSDIL